MAKKDWFLDSAFWSVGFFSFRPIFFCPFYFRPFDIQPSRWFPRGFYYERMNFHRAEFKRPEFQRLQKLLKIRLPEKLVKLKTHKTEKWVRADLCSHFKPYFLIYSIIGLFECEKGHFCAIFFERTKKISAFKSIRRFCFHENSAFIFLIFVLIFWPFNFLLSVLGLTYEPPWIR